ncbi:hypothetical protein Q5741_00660 [Paenibacillus sp. JX-17]|uniref:Uncharacterized protein n=1 Tax=Paenibacillus lacisoli TaxID=3064525 RepID=A0ABT9C6N8_9BACL|nr:hypothetical protein [Paenibacillus sp. JX-17]
MSSQAVFPSYYTSGEVVMYVRVMKGGRPPIEVDGVFIQADEDLENVLERLVSITSLQSRYKISYDRDSQGEIKMIRFLKEGT